MSYSQIIIELLVIQQKLADLVESAYQEGRDDRGVNLGWVWSVSDSKQALEELL